MPLRLIFMGTPDFAVPTLLELVAHGHEIAAVYTRAPKPAGRGMKLQLSPVEQEARRLGISVLTPTTLKTPEALEEFRAHNADAAVVVAYGMILPRAILEAPPLGCFNLHASLLPRWRGAAPVERAMLAGDDLTGVCVMRVEEGLDTGGVYAVRRVPISDTVTAAELRAELVTAGTEALVETLSAPVAEWIGEAYPQEGEATYAQKFTPDEFEIDWAVPVVDIHRLIRVGGAWTTFRSKRLKIHAADLVDGRIVPTLVQPEGKPTMTFDAWRNGSRPGPTELFGPQ